eukprot:1081144-Heterocapsa_arctica.AAC.1
MPSTMEHGTCGRRNANKLDDCIAGVLTGEHIDPSSGLVSDDFWLSNKHSRANLEGIFGNTFSIMDKNYNISAQNNKHGGSGPQAVTTYAGNGLDDPKWEN